jgi:hypothetical protein
VDLLYLSGHYNSTPYIPPFSVLSYCIRLLLALLLLSSDEDDEMLAVLSTEICCVVLVL